MNPTPFQQALVFALYLQRAHGVKPGRAAMVAANRYSVTGQDCRSLAALTGAADPGVIGSDAVRP